MNRHCNRALLAAFVISLSGVAAAGNEPPVAVNVDGLSPHVATTARQKASEGITALHRWVQRTRLVHGLETRSILREEPAAALATTPSTQRVALAEPAKP